MWFGHVEGRPVDLHQMEGSKSLNHLITRGREKLRKVIRDTIKKDLEIIELDRDMIYERTLWRCFTKWDKAWLLLYYSICY